MCVFGWVGLGVHAHDWPCFHIALFFFSQNDTSNVVFVKAVAVNLTYAFKPGGRCNVVSVLTTPRSFNLFLL